MPRGKAAPGDAGTEVDCGKPTPQYKVQTPPFYAAWATPLAHGTRAGLMINAQCQVMDMRGQVIPGLYCGGEAAGGFNRQGLGRCTARRTARLRDMDAMGVDQTLLYPTWFAEGFHLVHDPDVAYALARAYNNWIADFCQAAPDRLFAAAMVPLQNMDFALEELQRVARMPCFRGAFLRPMFIEGRYFTHPYYDPLWAELESLGLTAAVHPTPGLWNPVWTSHGPFVEKIRGRLHQAPLIGGGVGPFAGGGSGL